jgi:hypothetical protein
MSSLKVLPAQGVGHRDLYGDQVVVAAGHVVQRGPRYTNADQIGRPIGYRANGCEAGTHEANHGLVVASVRSRLIKSSILPMVRPAQTVSHPVLAPLIF